MKPLAGVIAAVLVVALACGSPASHSADGETTAPLDWKSEAAIPDVVADIATDPRDATALDAFADAGREVLPDACEPACSGRACGDDGCGGSCGTCGAGFGCNDGACVALPDCGDQACGADEDCGSCPADCGCACGEACDDGECRFVACSGRSCGPDGCNGSCGDCPPQQGCLGGACEPMPSCGNDFCNDNFGENCAVCPLDCPCACGEACQPDATCVFVACEGRTCGSDGCGGSCGTCAEHFTCQSGACVFVPWCGDHTCGAGETCASCPADCGCSTCGEACVGATCAFVACQGRECGPDGCGGTCGALGRRGPGEGGCLEHHACHDGVCDYVPWCGDGTCDANEDCAACPADCACPGCGDVCLAGQCVTMPCVGRECGPDGCGGDCGACPVHHACHEGVCALEPWCGDGACGANETCSTCPVDCACAGCGMACVAGACTFTGCQGRTCGADGCGGSCGACAEHFACQNGACAYVPWCGDGACNGGETCTTCPLDCACTGCGRACIEGACVIAACQGRECGDDGCGGVCGTLGRSAPGEGGCPEHFACQDGACVYEPWCGDGTCDPGEDCATCPDCACSGCGETCVGTTCAFVACQGRECGPDGCGGTCGSCPATHTCTAEGLCACTPVCDGRECGDDGCGGVCGALGLGSPGEGGCDAHYTCQEGTCIYEPWCGDASCDPNEDCASCPDDCGCTACGEGCVGGACTFTACAEHTCGDDGCGGSCGSCDTEHTGCHDGACVYEPWCGDGTCDADEDCASCPVDCGCTACGTTCVATAPGLRSPGGAACTFTACDGRECGTDGCGATCGACAAHYGCDTDGGCVYEPWCGDGTCDPDEGCGACPADCGCLEGQLCLGNGACCTPATCDSAGWTCGAPDDGCGTPLSCGDCVPPAACSGGVTPFACGVPEPLPYPTREPMRLKSIQPDFWPHPEEIAGNGAGGVAMNLVWAQWEPSLKAPPCSAGEEAFDGHCFQVSPAVDQAIGDWTTRGLVVTGVVYGVPAWARITTGCSPTAPGFEMFCVAREPADYARFAAYVAWRYNGLRGHGRVADFVIHNEVNANDWYDVGCGQGVYCEPTGWVERYAADWAAAYDGIVLQQPTAKVLTSFQHDFDPVLDAYGATHPIISVRTFLTWFAPLVGARDWRVAYHPYPTNLTSPTFGPRDFPRVTYGNIGALVGWLMATFPNDAHAWDVQLTESGINSLWPGSWPEAQVDGVCRSFRAVLGTPFVSNYVYHRMQDHPTEVADGLGLGLWDTAGAAKPAWATWALANRADLDPPQLNCGFELLPYTRLVQSTCVDSGLRWLSTRPAPSDCFELRAWRLLREPQPGTHLLFECLSGAGDSFATVAATCEGQRPMGPLGWAWDAPTADTVPLYRCFSGYDHFASTDPACPGGSTESLLGYVLP